MFLTASPKILTCIGAAVTIPVVGGGIAYAVLPNEKQVWLLVSDASGTETQPIAEIAFGKKQNYQCQHKKFVDWACQIKEAPITDASKKWVKLSDLKGGITQTTTTITKEALKAADKFYWLKASISLVNSIDWEEDDEKIDIIGSNTTAKYATFKPILFIDEDKLTTINTNYLVQAVEFLNIQTPPTDSDKKDTDAAVHNYREAATFKCVLPLENTKDCSIKIFASNQSTQAENTDFSSLTFDTSGHFDGTINKHHFYLVKFDPNLSVKEFEDLPDIHVAKNTSITSGIVTRTKKIKFKPIHRAVLIGETNNKKLILID